MEHCAAGFRVLQLGPSGSTVVETARDLGFQTPSSRPHMNGVIGEQRLS